MKAILLGMIRIYRACFSALFGPCCRFYPSCSHYAEEAIEKKGLLRGAKMTAKRLARCHPFHPGGYDPVQ